MKLKYTELFLIIGLFILGHTISHFDRLNIKLLKNEITFSQFSGRVFLLEDNKDFKIGKFDKPEEYSNYYRNISKRITDKEPGYQMNYRAIELERAKRNSNQKLKNSLDWISRGPSNIGGRTRGLVVDPDDPQYNTWFAGAASGGIWKTVDGGENWQNLSENFANLNISSIEMAESNHMVMYAGTGESFPGSTYMSGNGILKSVDRGLIWTQLASTATNPDFSYINRLAIMPLNESIVLAATETGIMKSVDGGTSWLKVYNSKYGVEDIKIDPVDNNIILAGDHSNGIIRSVDGGENWAFSSTGLALGTRYELSISPVDHNWIYTSISISDTKSNVFVSTDNGINWKKFNDEQNFLGGQGDYDNTIQAHPYLVDEVYLGGVDMWKLKFNGAISPSSPLVKNAYTVNTNFLDFVNFGGDFLQGGMSTKEGTNLIETDWCSVEIRFGPGLSQKAHRFTVPNESTSGVPAADYAYRNYVDVPFQVWDITNNRQLMVSFRDQEKDGLFNLYIRTGDAYGLLGREYIFVNSIPYSTTPDVNIIVPGGHLYKSLYMFWPTLADGSVWDPNVLPESKIVVEYGTVDLYNGVKTSIADSYGNYGGSNGYDQAGGLGKTKIPGLHPDHHNIKVLPIGNGNVKIIESNDGGLGISNDNGITFTQLPNNYITTQFYGVAKHPTKNEYLGGMQDNGTWRSPANEDASLSTKYLFMVGGDGFECLWNTKNPSLLLASVYYNSIRLSRNGGSSWINISGIDDNDGPFITKLTASKENPDLVFAVGSTGVYRSSNFGTSWAKRVISPNWAINDIVSSSHNTEVSLANGNIVWAGGGMAKEFGLQLHVSTNDGMNFLAVPDYTVVKMDSYISGLATHPNEDSTAFALFSVSQAPKILKTKNLGQTWEDISGFGTDTSSSNGFPDVLVHCLVVLPYNTDIIWVGTEIGLFESTNGGESWHYANNGLPPVAIYQMEIFGDQVVLATHGRGIWSVTLPDLLKVPFIKEFKQLAGKEHVINAQLDFQFDSVEVYIDNSLNKTLYSNTLGINAIPVMIQTSGKYWSQIIAYKDGIAYKSNKMDLQVTLTSIDNTEEFNKISFYPNPVNTYLQFDLESNIKNYKLELYSVTGANVYSIENTNNMRNMINVELLPSGTYFVNLFYDNRRTSKVIMIKH